MPTRVLVSVTPEVRDFLNECNAEGAKEQADAATVDLDELYRLADEHHRNGGGPAKIHELLANSEVVGRQSEPEAPMTELERMRLASEERAYQRSVQSVVPLKEHRKTPSQHQQGLRFATNFATQVVVAFIGAFLFGYYFVETFVAPENFEAKVIFGAACSFATLLLETMLLLVHEQKMRMIEEKRLEVEQKEEERRRRVAKAKCAVGGVVAPSAAASPEPEPKPSNDEAAPPPAADEVERPKPHQDKKED